MFQRFRDAILFDVFVIISTFTLLNHFHKLIKLLFYKLRIFTIILNVIIIKRIVFTFKFEFMEFILIWIF